MTIFKPLEQLKIENLDTHSKIYSHHNFKLISNAIDFYQNLGFEQIEVPWFVPHEYNLITKPAFLHNEKSFYLSHGLFEKSNHELVGSAEQGFIYLALNNEIEEGKNYLAFSPCFRSEPVVDKNHLYYFLKVELFSYFKVDTLKEQIHLTDYNNTNILQPSVLLAKEKMVQLYKSAFDFFSSVLSLHAANSLNSINTINTKDFSGANLHGFDIELNQVEVGSYGNRYIEYDTPNTVNKKILIAYGTGIAEPRFSQNIIY